MRVIRLLRRFPWIHSFLHRRADQSCAACRYVWRTIESDPAFIAAMAQGEADLAAGRFVEWRDE